MGQRIDRIYVSGYRHDIRFARACVASIRRWYPTIRITLIKDLRYGKYWTRDIEFALQCDVLDHGGLYGWGFGKLEPLFRAPGERFLVLDADVLMAGPVLERLEASDAEFVVQREDNPPREHVDSLYFDLTRLGALDPGFEYPGYTFNTGQWVGTSGLISRDELAFHVDYWGLPTLKHPEVFKCGEQGLLNYVLIKGAVEGRWRLDRQGFMEVGSNRELDEVTVAGQREGRGLPIVIHWCGMRHPGFETMARGDLWVYYEERFFGSVPFGRWYHRWLAFCRKWRHRLWWLVKGPGQ